MICEAGGQSKGEETVKFNFLIANGVSLFVLLLGCRDSSFVSDQPIQLTEAGAVTAQADAQPEAVANDGEVQQQPKCSSIADGTAVAVALKHDVDDQDSDDDDSEDHENENHCESEHDHDDDDHGDDHD